MKSTGILLLAGLITVSSCKENDNKEGKSTWLPDVTNKDHGPSKQKEYKGDFDEIEVSQAIEAEIIKSDVEKVVIFAPQNLIDEVLVDNRGGELHIHYKNGIRVMNTNNVKAKIYAKDFTKIKANSSATIIVRDKFTQDKTDVEVSSSSHISGHLEANKLSIDANSSGSFNGEIWAVNLSVQLSSGSEASLSGKAEKAEFNASSGSNANAKDVVVKDLKAEASSGAGIVVSATNSIDAESSSGASIDVYKKGNVTDIRMEENSGGSVSVK